MHVCSCDGIAVIAVAARRVEQLAVQLTAMVPESINITQYPHRSPTHFRIQNPEISGKSSLWRVGTTSQILSIRDREFAKVYLCGASLCDNITDRKRGTLNVMQAEPTDCQVSTLGNPKSDKQWWSMSGCVLVYNPRHAVTRHMNKAPSWSMGSRSVCPTSENINVEGVQGVFLKLLTGINPVPAPSIVSG